MADWEQMYRAKQLVLRSWSAPHLCYWGCELGLGSTLWKSGGRGWGTPGKSSPCPPALLSDVNKSLENKDCWDTHYRCGLLSHTKVFLFSETRAKFSFAPCWLWVMQWNCKLLLSQYVSDDNEVGWDGSLLLIKSILHQWFKPVVSGS